jgi:hypothetical protein
MPPLPQSFNERTAAICPTISASFCIKSQKSARACSSGVSGRGTRTILYSILVSSFLPGLFPRRTSAYGFRPCLSAMHSQHPTKGHGFCLLTTKPKWSALLATSNSSLLRKPLQTGIQERKRILNLREAIAPTLEYFSDLDGAHGLARIFIKYSQYEFCPRDFCLYLLPQSPLESDPCSLQVRDFCIQLVALTCFYFDRFLNLLKRVLESLSHSGSDYKHFEVDVQALI